MAETGGRDGFGAADPSAEPRSADQPPKISVPKGGGAIQSIGEKFAVNAVSGTSSLTIPLGASPGRAGFGPDLTLAYDSGSGNGPFGFGWSLAVQSITRRTDKGLPDYRDDRDSDVFVLAGAEDLVPLLDEDGARSTDAVSAPGFTIHRYRPRVEALFARIERWTNRADGQMHWRVRSRDNVTTVYGNSARSRIAEGDRTFTWLVSESFDDRGNAIVYEYVAEDDAGVDTSLASERNRIRGANRYLKRIRYGNVVSRLVDPDLTGTAWLFEVVFDYDEGHYDELAVDPERPIAEQHRFVRASASPTTRWSARPDPFSSHRAGFEVRTYRRCHRVLVFHNFPELGDDPYLVRATEFDYADLDYASTPTVDDELAHQGSTHIGSFIVGATRSGFVREGDVYLKQSLPPLELEYSRPAIDEQVREVDADSIANLPVGFHDDRYQWIDLDGEGLSGILTEQGGAWFYKSNLGKAHFGSLRPVAVMPSLAAARGRPQFLDLAADGQLDSVALAGPTRGYYERTGEDDEWLPFREFRELPEIRWDEPSLRLVDLNGDGHADALITEQDFITWYPSLAERGFGSARRAHQPSDEERGPRLSFADADESVFVADMSGDGLMDLVRIRNGEVAYWPNKGYGRFGAKVTMDRGPWFDTPDRFDGRRVHLADIDGSGTTDIIYLGSDDARVYFNQMGNAWSDARRLGRFPQADDLTAVMATDLLGNGTAALVWSSSSPADAGRSLRYIDLMAAGKPHLLVRTRNNLGAETSVRYVASTQSYLDDQRAGTQWITKLPFPVHVVERVDTFDRVSNSRFVSRYRYHHGYFDGAEREFRGFAMVERLDTEELAALTAAGELGMEANIDPSSHVPPVLVKSWFHTGAHSADAVSALLATEYYAAGEELLADTLLPEGLSPSEQREACRALKGSMLREEVYGLDGSDRQPHPFTVTEQNFTVEVLQRRGPNRHAVFFTHAREALGYSYERVPDDPRVTHTVTLDADRFGNVLRSAAIGYGRRRRDSRLALADQERQNTTFVTVTENRVTNAIDGPDAYRTPLTCQARTYELHGLELPAPSRRLGLEELSHAAAVASVIPHERRPVAGRLEKRILSEVRTLFRRDDLTGPLALGELESRALPFDGFELALTPGLVERAYGDRVTDTMLRDEGRYVQLEGDDGWWTSSGRLFYAPADRSAPEDELAFAHEHFFLPRRFRDAFHAEGVPTESSVTYDAYDLLALETCDALGNRTTVGERDIDPERALVTIGQDYRTLGPLLVMDPNRNRSAVAVDALGIVVATAGMGKPEEDPTPGDSVVGIRADLTRAEVEGVLGDPSGPFAAELLGDATTRVVHDLGAWWREHESTQKSPPVVATLSRETHASDPVPAGGLRVQVTFSYSDGWSREIQRKVQAPAGPDAPRWICTGWTIFNNKGKPIRQYEPFFTNTSRFERDVRVGVSAVLLYDAADRLVTTLNPDHTWDKTVFDAWRRETWDPGDTVLVADPRTDPDVGRLFARLPEADYLPSWYDQRADGALGAPARMAARKASVHADTPTVAHADPLGRTVVVEVHNRWAYGDEAPRDDRQVAQVILDVAGRQREAIDPLGRVVMRHEYNLLGSPILQASMDAGERRTLADSLGKPIYAWDARGHRLRTSYDALRRPTDTYLRVGAGGDDELLLGRSVYGESLPNPEAENLRGHPVRVLDQAGETIIDAFDFAGRTLRTSRRFAEDYRSTLDWSDEVGLEDSAYTTRTRYDAFGRPLELIAPDATAIRPSYDTAGLLERVVGDLPDDTDTTGFVAGIDYDAHGRRTRVEYGNGVTTTYSYDPLTQRLQRLRTSRGSDTLQDLSYTYDAVGNPTHVRDAAQDTLFFRNQRIEASAEYTYDARARLIEATGREHVGQASSPSDGDRVGRTSPGDGNAMARYVERYMYDAVGNFREVVHHGTDRTSPGWRRAYEYDEPSRIDPDVNGNRLTSTRVADTTETYTFDEHGNTLGMSHVREMGWDVLDQLRTTRRQAVGEGGDGEQTWYVYDTTGRRVRKVTRLATGRVKDERVYVGGFEVYRRHGAKPLVRTTLAIGADDARVALVETRVHGDDSGPHRLIRYQVGDALGSSKVELDDTARILSYEEYTPYGSTSYQAVVGRTEAPKRYRYSGKERDEESGFCYFGSRYYAPWLARWMSVDPKGMVDGPNLYAYARANPVVYTDRTGTECNPELQSCADPTSPGVADPLMSSAKDDPRSREEIEQRCIAPDPRAQDKTDPPPAPKEYKGPEIRATTPQELNDQKMDRMLVYDEPPDETGYTAEDYLGYALIYGLKQTVYKPIKAAILDERPQYLDADNNVKTVPWRPDRSGDLAVAFGTIATFVLPTPKVVSADVAVADGTAGAFRIVVTDGKPVIQFANAEGLPVMANAAGDAPLVRITELPVQEGSKTVAATLDGPVVTSGWGEASQIPGYGTPAVDVWRFYQETGVPVRSHIFDFPGAPGSYYASHAEPQALFLDVGADFLQVSKAPCCSCRDLISRAAVSRGQGIVVLSPRGFQWYLSNGQIVQ